MFLQILFERLRQGYNTMKYPAVPPANLPPLYAGRPELRAGHCDGCAQPCVKACPTGALTVDAGNPALDTGKCLFCRNCEKNCPHAAIHFSSDHQLAATRRSDLVVKPGSSKPALYHPQAQREFRRSFTLRVVSAGGCNACEADTNVLTTLAWDISRFGIRYAASPRHADGVIVTGPVTANMVAALQDTFAAVPEPKVVIALGTCAISGGIFAPGIPAGRENASAFPVAPSSGKTTAEERIITESGVFRALNNNVASAEVSAVPPESEANTGVRPCFPVDLFIPGCPPHPFTILDALLRFIGKIKN